MIATRNSTRLGSTLALLAVLLRVLLPALHTHGHAHDGHGDARAVACSCGHEHGPHGDVAPEGELRDDAHGEHHCLACEIEAGTPCGFPPAPDHLDADAPHAARAGIWIPEVLADDQVRLPPTRAPPADAT